MLLDFGVHEGDGLAQIFLDPRKQSSRTRMSWTENLTAREEPAGIMVCASIWP